MVNLDIKMKKQERQLKNGEKRSLPIKIKKGKRKIRKKRKIKKKE